MQEIMHKGMWYGEVSTEISTSKLWSEIYMENNMRSKILKVVELLKLGDFSAKRLLIKIMNESKDEDIINLAIRVFCSVANHEDILNVNNLKLLSNCSEDAVSTFVSSAEATMSYQVVPYLLALLDEWDDTDIEIQIKDVLASMLQINDDYEEYSVEDFDNIFTNIVDNKDIEKYYYSGEIIFPGLLTKELIERCYIAVQASDTLKMHTVPSLLSIYSGKLFPVDFFTEITDVNLKQVLNYVDSLSNMSWEKGCKYFYGHRIN